MFIFYGRYVIFWNLIKCGSLAFPLLIPSTLYGKTRSEINYKSLDVICTRRLMYIRMPEFG